MYLLTDKNSLGGGSIRVIFLLCQVSYLIAYLSEYSLCVFIPLADLVSVIRF